MALLSGVLRFASGDWAMLWLDGVFLGSTGAAVGVSVGLLTRRFGESAHQHLRELHVGRREK